MLATACPAKMTSAAKPAVRPVVLLILDGFGCRPDAPDNAITQRAHAELESPRRVVPAYVDRRVGARRRPAAGADGQLRSRASQHRRGSRRLPGLHAHRPGDRDGRIRAQSGADGRRRARQARTGQPSTCWGSLSPGGVHSHERQIAAMVELAAAGGAPRILVHAFLDGRDTPPKSAARLARLPWSAVCARTRRRAHRVDRRPLLRHGPRPALGARCDRPTTCSSTAARTFSAPDGAGRARRGLRARRDRRIRQGHGDRSMREGRPATMADGDVVVFMNFRADRAREITRALTDPRLRRLSAQARAAPRALTSASRATATSSRTCPSPSRRSRSPTASANTWRSWAWPSCASPRPRSTRTSPTSSMAASRPSIPARTASSCRRRRSRPTTSSPR